MKQHINQTNPAIRAGFTIGASFAIGVAVLLSCMGWMAMAEEQVVKKAEQTGTVVTKTAVSGNKTEAVSKKVTTVVAKKTAVSGAKKGATPAIQKAVLRAGVKKRSYAQVSGNKGAIQKVSAKGDKALLAPGLGASLKKADYKTTDYSLTTRSRSTTGFFSLSLGHIALPLRYFEYYDITLNFRYGGYVSEQSSFEAGVKFGIKESILVMLKYNYDFLSGKRWIPGLDIALLLGRFGIYESRSRYLDAGLEVGPYVRVFISKSHALFLRTGVVVDTSRLHTHINIADELKLYLNLGIQWHF